MRCANPAEQPSPSMTMRSNRPGGMPAGRTACCSAPKVRRPWLVCAVLWPAAPSAPVSAWRSSTALPPTSIRCPNCVSRVMGARRETPTPFEQTPIPGGPASPLPRSKRGNGLARTGCACFGCYVRYLLTLETTRRVESRLLLPSLQGTAEQAATNRRPIRDQRGLIRRPLKGM